MTAWIIVSSILLVIWVIAFLVGVGAWIYPDWYDKEEKEMFKKYFPPVMFVAFIFAVAHWILLLLAVPVFLVYGAWRAIVVLHQKPWKRAESA